MPILLRDHVLTMIHHWGEDNPFYGNSKDGQLVEQWTTDLDGLEIFYSFVRNSTWIRITVLPTQTGIRPQGNAVFRWKGQINEHIADSVVWWAFELLTEREAAMFKIQNKPMVTFQFIRMGHSYEHVATFDGYNWILAD